MMDWVDGYAKRIRGSNRVSATILQGLITQDRGDKLAQHKIFFARNDNNGEQYKGLLDVIEYVKPTV